MEFKITIGEETREVELDVGGSEEISTVLKSSDPKKHRVTILKREKNLIILSIENKVYSVVQNERTNYTVSFIANGHTIRSRIAGSEKRGGQTSSLVATANELIASNFPAKIVKLLAKKGDALKEGDTLVVLEAMKMEAQIKAPHDCTVEEVFVKEGEMVERGKKMIRLKFG
jgi:biotin carboxyl carrier protein